MRRRRPRIMELPGWVIAAAQTDPDRGWLERERRRVRRRTRAIDLVGYALAAAALVVAAHLVATTPQVARVIRPDVVLGVDSISSFPACLRACADLDDDVEAWRRGVACECRTGAKVSAGAKRR